MTGPARAFTVRAPDVVHDTIDGETLVINLETGSYYTLEGAGAVAWQALEGGATQAAVAAAVAEALGLDRSAVAAPVARLLGQLLDQGLVRASEAGDSTVEPETDVESGGESAVGPASELTPDAALPGLDLRCYDELQELLVIDPIHEVDEAGWPNRAPQSA